VQTRLDGDHLFIIAQNGKEIRLKVVQRQRL
jgi:hemin uptake protein HemP